MTSQGNVETVVITEASSPTASETEEIAKELFAVVCKNGGMVELKDAVGALSAAGKEYVKQPGIYPLMQSSLSDVLKLEVEQPGNRATLRAKVGVELCKNYGRTECLLDECPRLHVCPMFVKGNCPSAQNQNCALHHNFVHVHEQGILTKFNLDTLNESSLLPLLRNIIFDLSDANVEVCAQYNSVQGCLTGYSCVNFHLCIPFSKGECENGATCAKSHDVLAEKFRLAENFQIREQQIIRATRIINFQQLLNFAQNAAKDQACTPSIDEICGFHLKGNCRYGRLCTKYWNNLPYLWQITVTLEDDSEKWINFPSEYSQIIEWDYCDVNKDTSLEINIGQAPLRVDLNEMVAKAQTGNQSVKIRRLSTASWVKAAPGDSFGTRWTWYWTNDQSHWVPYDGAGHQVSSTPQISSNETLEEHFLSGAESFTMSVNGQTYNIDLKNFQQTNPVTGKSRRIRRRPTQFIGTQNIATILSARRRQHETRSPPSRPSLPTAPRPSFPTVGNITLPQGWTAMSADQDFVMVSLQPSSPQYVHVQTEFKKTLTGKTIHKIERVQNIDLWESYSRKLSKLSRKLGRPVEVRELFHGTNENSIKAICQQGFDWRLSGAHGTACGKGSYFAVAASYSNGYATVSQQTRHQMMFFNKVIVGLYTVGNSSTVRPPPRDPSKPFELYHSCVNNQANPVMFVVFENDQAYPEFLISYS